MKRSKSEILFENATALYKKATRIIGETYDNYFAGVKDFRYAKEEIFADYDGYLQALLIKIAYDNANFDLESMRFIENIVDFGKLIDGTDLTFFAGGSTEILSKLNEKAEERLKEIPTAFKLLSAVDSAKDIGVSSALFTFTAKILFSFNLLSQNSEEKDGASVPSSLKNLYSYLLSKGIKFNR